MKELPQMKWFFKSFVLVLFLTFNLSAMPWDISDGSSDSDSGSSEAPKSIVIDGDALEEQSETQYYKFYSTVNQNITSHITEHENGTFRNNKRLRFRFRYMNGDGTCGDVIDDSSEIEENGNWTFTAEGGKNYCIEVEEESDWSKASHDYTINLTSDAALEVGISDASKREDDSPMTFVVALTKASSHDITVEYTFTDVSAKNGVNYDVDNGSVVIPAGSLGADINVTLIDADITTSKTFTINISSSTTVNSESSSATGTILPSKSTVIDEDSDYEGPDICYDSRETSGFCMFGSCMFYQEKTNVRSMVNGLEDIDIKKALTRGMAFMDFASGIGIDDTSKTLEPSDFTA
jgi:hypothetical protein